jgi:hypothetical protein
MFVQINPDVSSYSETLSTLKFAERVSGVELGASKANKEGKDIREFMEQVINYCFPFADPLFIQGSRYGLPMFIFILSNG